MKLLVTGVALLVAFGIKAQIISIPDPYFKQRLIAEGVDTDLDEEISVAEALTVTSLDVSMDTISDLTGLEEFTNLINFNCSSNDLDGLDVSANVALQSLTCDGCTLSNLDLTNNTQLWRLNCMANQLTSLDLSNQPLLTTLIGSYNNINTIDLSNNTLLDSLWFSDNDLTTINLNANPHLKLVLLNDNLLESIIYDNRDSLTDFYCRSNNLTSVDLSGTSTLKYAYCSKNNLTTLLVDNCPNLINLFATDNLLPSMDFTADSSLEQVELHRNEINSLVFDGNINLKRLYLNDNKMSSFDFSEVPVLDILYCERNEFNHLKVHHPTITRMYSGNDGLSLVDIRESTNMEILAVYDMGDVPVRICVWQIPMPPYPDFLLLDSGSEILYYSLCLTGDEELAMPGLKPFPNPFYEMINIPISTAWGIGTLSLVNDLGEVVFTTKVNGESEVIVSKEQLPPGVYFGTYHSGLGTFNLGTIISR